MERGVGSAVEACGCMELYVTGLSRWAWACDVMNLSVVGVKSVIVFYMAVFTNGRRSN